VVKNGEEGPSYFRFDQMRTILYAVGDSHMQRAVIACRAGRSASSPARSLRARSARAREFEADWHRRSRFRSPRFASARSRADCAAAAATVRARAEDRGDRRDGGYVALLQLSSGLIQTERFPIGLRWWLPDLALLAASGVLARGPSFRARARGSGEPVGAGDRLRATSAGSCAPIPGRAGWGSSRSERCGFVALLIALVLIDVVDNLQWFTKYRSTARRGDAVLRRACRCSCRAVVRSRLLSLRRSREPVRRDGRADRHARLRHLGIRIVRSDPGAVRGRGGRLPRGDRPVGSPRDRTRTQIKRVEIKAQETERLSVWSRDATSYQATASIARRVAQGITISS